MTSKAQSKRVLIVDDEPNVTVVLADVLENLGGGYVVDTANSGDEALDKIRNAAYVLVITDYKMPGMDGLALARAIRQSSPDTQVVLMTAYGTRGLRDAVKGLELDGYIDKPFTMTQIRQIVERAVQRTSQEEPRSVSGVSAEQPVYERVHALQANTGARCVLLLSSSGYLIEAVGQIEELDISSVSALVAANFMAAAELAKMLRSGSVFKSSYHEGPDHNIYSYDVNGELLLAVIFGAESKPGVVWFYTKQTATELASVVVDQATTVEVTANLAAAVDAELDQLFDLEDATTE